MRPLFDGGVAGAGSVRGLGAARRGSTRPRRSSHDAPEAVAVIAGIVAVAVGIAFATQWDPHWTAPGLRAAVETAIALMILLTGVLAMTESRRHRHIEPLLLLAALVAVGLTNFVAWAPQVVT